MRRLVLLLLLLPLVGAALTVSAGAQQATITAADYARADKFLAPALTPLVIGGSVAATWLPDDRFWYRNTTADGIEFVIIDPVKKTRGRAFDHAKLAAALGTVTGQRVDANHLPIDAMELKPDG